MTPTAVSAASCAEGTTLAADAPFFIVMNAGSGRRQSDATRTVLERELVRALDLALDLGLADDHRLEPRGHAVQVPRRPRRHPRRRPRADRDGVVARAR